MLHILPKNILSYHITILSFHNFSVSPIINLFHHLTIPLLHHYTITPYNHHTIELIPPFSKSTLIYFSFFYVSFWSSFPIFQSIWDNTKIICRLKKWNCYHVCLSWNTFEIFVMLNKWSKNNISECKKMTIIPKCLHLSVK